MNNLEKRIKDLHKSGGSLYEGGSYGVSSIKLTDDKKVAVYFLEREIAYHRKGMSYYQGVNVFDGKTEIVVKPVSLWRDGENQHNDKPYNQHFVVSFKKIESEAHGYELVLRDGEGMVEIIKVNFRSKKVASLKVMTSSEYMEQKQNKTIGEKISLVRTRIYEVLRADNPSGYNGFEKTLILDLNCKKLIPVDEFGKDWAPHFDNPENKLLIVDTHECLYGNPFLDRVFFADPTTQQVADVIVDTATKTDFSSFKCVIEKDKLLIKFTGYNKTHSQRTFELSDLKKFFS